MQTPVLPTGLRRQQTNGVSEPITLLKPGFLFNNRYLVVRQIAQSRHGAVYEAIDRRTRQRVVLKQKSLPPLDAATHGYFEQMADYLQRLRHPNLPRVTDAFMDAAGQFIVMDLVAGDDLATLMQQRQYQPFPLRDVLAWADQLLDVLAYMHAHHEPIIHGDVKPHNLKIDPQGSLMLVDLGVPNGTRKLSVLDRVQASGALYAAPEQVQGSHPDPRSDLYALAATFYYLLTGGPFPTALDRALTLSLGQPDPLLPIDKINLKVPPEIAAVIGRALAHRPADRYPDALAMRHALGERHDSQMVIVSRHGDGTYTTISDAIAHARPGQRILVRPGWYAESLIIDRPVSIMGEGSPADIVVESVDAACLYMQTSQAEVHGLTLHGRTTPAGHPFFAVDISQGTLMLENCVITSDSLACVSIHGANANPLLRRCVIHGGASAGIDVYNQGQGTIEDCEIFENARSGIEISNGGNPLVRRCIIRNGLASGIYVTEDGQGTVEDCEILANARAGVAISAGGNPMIRHCQIATNKSAGVFVYKQGRGVVEDCEIFGNSASGIEMKEGGDPMIRRCIIRDGEFSGIYCHEDGLGTVASCQIYGNKAPGITIAFSGSPVIRTCQIYDGYAEGIWVTDYGEGTIENAEVYGNAHTNILISQGGNPLIRRSHIRDARQSGILVTEQGSGLVEECSIVGNHGSGITLASRGTLTATRCRINQNKEYAVHVQRNGAGVIRECDLKANAGGAWFFEGKHQVKDVENVV